MMPFMQRAPIQALVNPGRQSVLRRGLPAFLKAHCSTHSDTSEPSSHNKLRSLQDAFPSTKGFPLLGDLNVILNPRKMHEYYLKVAREKGFTFRVPLGKHELLIIGDPEFVEHVFAFHGNAKNYAVRPKLGLLVDQAKMIDPAYNEPLGLLFGSGERQWRLPRMAAQDGLTKNSFIRGVTSEIWEITEELIDLWKKRCAGEKVPPLLQIPTKTAGDSAKQGAQFDISVDLQIATLDIIGYLGFCQHLNGLKGEDVEVARLTNKWLGRSNELWYSPFPYWRYIPSKAFKEMTQSFKRLVDIAAEVVQRRRVALKEAEANGSAQEQGERSTNTFIDLLLEGKTVEGVAPLTDYEVAVNSLVLLMAGHDTTALTVAWTLRFLAENPEIQERAREEVIGMMEGLEAGKVPTHQDMESLKFITQCLKETLRIRPVAPFMLHMAEKDDAWKGIRIPAKQRVYVAPYLLGRNPKYWTDPETYNPDRFGGRGRAESHPYSWVPFGMGPRACVGSRLAMVEARVLLGRLLSQFRFVLPPGAERSPTGLSEVVLRPESCELQVLPL